MHGPCGSAPRAYKVGTLAGLIQPEVRADGQVAVDMGEPVLTPSKVPCELPVTQDGAAVRAKMEVRRREGGGSHQSYTFSASTHVAAGRCVHHPQPLKLFPSKVHGNQSSLSLSRCAVLKLSAAGGLWQQGGPGGR